MDSKRERILQHVASVLEDIEAVNGRVFRSRIEAFQRSEAPAIVIEPGPDEAAAPSASNCWIDWTFVLVVAVITRGQIPEQMADPIVQDIHSRLMSNRSLGGVSMDVWPMGVEPTFEKADRPSLWTVMTFRVRYRTSTTDLSA
jgi:hypothetical protein